MKKSIPFLGLSLLLFLAFAFTPATIEVPRISQAAEFMPPSCNGVVKVNIPMSYTGTVGVRIVSATTGAIIFSEALPSGGGVFTVFPSLPAGDIYDVCLGATTPVTVAAKYHFCGEYDAETTYTIAPAGIAICLFDPVDLT